MYPLFYSSLPHLLCHWKANLFVSPSCESGSQTWNFIFSQILSNKLSVYSIYCFYFSSSASVISFDFQIKSIVDWTFLSAMLKFQNLFVFLSSERIKISKSSDQWLWWMVTLNCINLSLCLEVFCCSECSSSPSNHYFIFRSILVLLFLP